MGTMLLIVGWSAVVVWLNVRPRIYGLYMVGSLTPAPKEPTGTCFVEYGYPWACWFTWGEAFTIHYRALAGNIAIGLLAVAVLTFASKYLVRAIVAGLRAFLSKPPPSNGKGPERASEGD